MTRHLISIEDLDRDGIEKILERAEAFSEVTDRHIKKVPALRGRTVLNLFYEASTRTRSSFELAAKRLSADVVNFAASGSSVEKGESLKVTVCGPPTLIPRGIEALGCEVRYELSGLRDADVVYALRMQNERMHDAYVPSLREYAARYQINGRRLGPRQILMHPGPVNRGVELSGEVVDSPQAVITMQVKSGVVVRMAVLYELLASAPADDRLPSPEEPQLA